MWVHNCHRVTCLMWRVIVFHKDKVPSTTPPSPMVARDHSESGCSDAWLLSHWGWPGCSFRHYGLHLRPTPALPPLWYRKNLDTSLKLKCLQWRRPQTRCLWPHSRRRGPKSWTSGRTLGLMSSSQTSVFMGCRHLLSTPILWSGHPCCLLCHGTLLMQPCITRRILASSHWELSCVDNKTIYAPANFAS